MEYPSNVILLLLQIILKRQQLLAHQDKSLNMDVLLREPIIDRATLNEFQNHKLVLMYAPDVANMQMRSLRTLVKELFEGETANDDASEGEPITVVSLANHYYEKRIEELEKEQLPLTRRSILELLKS